MTNVVVVGSLKCIQWVQSHTVHVEKSSILVSVWLLWYVPRLHVACIQVTTGLVFFLRSSYFSE